MKPVIAVLALFLSFSSAAFASGDNISIEVDASNFGSNWRFALTQEGRDIGDYTCVNPFIAEIVSNRTIKWRRGNCSVKFRTSDLGLTGQIVFETNAAWGVVGVRIGGVNKISFVAPAPAPTTISLSTDGQKGMVSINTGEVIIDANGYKGECGFERLYDGNGEDFQSCDGTPTYLPRGTSWDLVIGGHQRHSVYIGDDGTPFPYNVNGQTASLSLRRPNIISLTTIDVRITPSVDINWNLAGASDPKWKNGVTRGAQTVRLPRFGQYRIGVHPADADASGANFTLPVGCDGSVQTLYIPDYEGVFRIQQLCDTVRR